MSYIYGAPILDVSRSHTTTQHSRVKFVLVSFVLGFVLLRESSILDPSHEIWE